MLSISGPKDVLSLDPEGVLKVTQYKRYSGASVELRWQQSRFVMMIKGPLCEEEKHKNLPAPSDTCLNEEH